MASRSCGSKYVPRSKSRVSRPSAKVGKRFGVHGKEGSPVRVRKRAHKKAPAPAGLSSVPRAERKARLGAVLTARANRSAQRRVEKGPEALAVLASGACSRLCAAACGRADFHAPFWSQMNPLMFPRRKRDG